MTRDLKQAIGSQAKRARENADLTQERLAELIERTKDAVSSIERGVNLPSLDTLARISQVTRVPMTFMVETVDSKREDDETLSRIKLILKDLSQDDRKLALVIIEAIANQRRTKISVE